jgi:hypothetical protein
MCLSYERPIVHGEGHSITLRNGTTSPGSAFADAVLLDKLSADEVAFGLGQENSFGAEREVAVKVDAGSWKPRDVFEQKRRRTCLTLIVTL